MFDIIGWTDFLWLESTWSLNFTYTSTDYGATTGFIYNRKVLPFGSFPQAEEIKNLPNCVLFSVFSAMKRAARFLCQTMQENSWNITMASLDWFTAYLVRLFDLSSPCFFQRATCILARQMRPNARQSDNNIGWQRQAENCKRDDGPTRLAETSSILIAVESPLFLLMRTLFWVTSLFP